jgi:hypothetical protein
MIRQGSRRLSEYVKEGERYCTICRSNGQKFGVVCDSCSRSPSLKDIRYGLCSGQCEHPRFVSIFEDGGEGDMACDESMVIKSCKDTCTCIRKPLNDLHTEIHAGWVEYMRDGEMHAAIRALADDNVVCPCCTRGYPNAAASRKRSDIDGAHVCTNCKGFDYFCLCCGCYMLVKPNPESGLKMVDGVLKYGLEVTTAEGFKTDAYFRDGLGKCPHCKSLLFAPVSCATGRKGSCGSAACHGTEVFLFKSLDGGTVCRQCLLTEARGVIGRHCRCGRVISRRAANRRICVACECSLTLDSLLDVADPAPPQPPVALATRGRRPAPQQAAGAAPERAPAPLALPAPAVDDDETEEEEPPRIRRRVRHMR